jgi:hypothetical protein
MLRSCSNLANDLPAVPRPDQNDADGQHSRQSKFNSRCEWLRYVPSFKDLKNKLQPRLGSGTRQQ